MTGASPVTTIHGYSSVAEPRNSAYSSDRACPCHAANVSFNFVLSKKLAAMMPEETFGVTHYAIGALVDLVVDGVVGDLIDLGFEH